MRKLNSAYRGIDKTTDVLSFAQGPIANSRKSTQGKDYLLGDIVVNLHKAEKQAREYNSAFYEELKKLLIHGLLHLLGYDHEADARADRAMKKKSRDLSEKLSM
jgi:probable rRNA maturation factor